MILLLFYNFSLYYLRFFCHFILSFLALNDSSYSTDDEAEQTQASKGHSCKNQKIF